MYRENRNENQRFFFNKHSFSVLVRYDKQSEIRCISIVNLAKKMDIYARMWYYT